MHGTFAILRNQESGIKNQESGIRKISFVTISKEVIYSVCKLFAISTHTFIQ